MRRLMPALSPATTLPMRPPSTQSLFARYRCYLDRGDVSRLLRGHCSSVIAPTDSCADPLALLSFGLSFVRGVFAGCYQPRLPAGPSRLISANLSSDAGPLPRRSHGVHLPVSSSMSSAFPQQGDGVGFPLNPRTRFWRSVFRAADISLCSDLRFAHLPDRSYRCAYRRRAVEAFTSGRMLRCLRTHRICQPPDTGNWRCGDFHPTRFSALSAAPVIGREDTFGEIILSAFGSPDCGFRVVEDRTNHRR